MTFLTAEWRKLLLANYEIDPVVLKPFLPAGTELDTFNGMHYASLVGFLFANTKVRGVSIPGHGTFEEVNLRFYVRCHDGNEWKRGVVFIKEIVPRRAICWVANLLYGENYVYHPMRHHWQENKDRLDVGYEWKKDGRWNFLRASADKKAIPIEPGSEADFITEHYWGYTKMNARSTGAYQVLHPRWEMHPVQSFEIQCDVAGLYGATFADALGKAPRSVLLAAGSAVSVLKGGRIQMAKS